MCSTAWLQNDGCGVSDVVGCDPTCPDQASRLPVCTYNHAASSVIGSDHDTLSVRSGPVIRSCVGLIVWVIAMACIVCVIDYLRAFCLL